MADKSGGLALVPGTDMLIQVQIGTEFREVTGAGSVDYTPPEAPTNEVKVFRRKAKLKGEADIGNLTMDIPGLVTGTEVDALLAKAYDDDSVLLFRIQSEAQLLFTAASTAMVAIAVTTGLVTFSGTGDGINLLDDNYGVGHSIKNAANFYLISYIPQTWSASGSVPANQAKVYPAPDAAVTAATYSVGLEARRWQFNAQVASYGGITTTAGEGSPVSSQLILSPTAPIPQPVLQGGF